LDPKVEGQLHLGDQPGGRAIVLAENDDRPGVIGPFTTALGEAGINISMMRVSSKDGVNMMAVSVDSNVDDATLARLRSVSGVRKVRVLRFK
ncbi:MAG TPA: ACT domain-containing protein, partial [Syntrophothermus lipocalidus]|nr:ACT domain-containing protein [Syntrophothermus lipocalidus]